MEAEFFCTSSDDSKLETDPEKLCQLLEAKLNNERAAWQRTRARHRTIRALSFILLFFIIIGAMVAFFIVTSRLAERRAETGSQHSSSMR
jgi:hypothetical protein